MTDARQPPHIANEDRTAREAAALAPVFIYSGYRTSSTWLWSKFRKDANACAYYEPFNEILAGLKADAILSVRPDSWRSHHPADAAYMAEYGPLLGNDPGVPLFPHGDPDGERYVGAEGVDGPLDPDVLAYVANLIAGAQGRGRAPLLACTRMLGRSAGLSSAFGGCHILLIRNLFQQWCSYSGQLRFGNDYFFRTLHKSLNLASKDEYISFLSGFFSDNEIADFSAWINPINHDRVFCYFAAFHAYFLMATRRQADIVIDVNQLARQGFNYQAEIASLVAARTGLRIDLADVRESVDYPVQPLRSTDDCRMLLQTMLDRLLLSEARDDVDRRFVAGLVADLWEEHARFTAATAGAAEVIAGEIARAQDEARRRAEVEALQAQTSATLAQLEHESATRIDAMKAEAEEASSQLEATMQQVAEQERQRADEAQAHAAALATAQSAAAEASSRLDAAMQQVAELERQRADEAQAHAAALATAQAALAEASSRLEATLQKVASLERQLGEQAQARSAANAAAQAAAALASSRLDSAMRDLARLERESAEQVRSHALALGAANDRIAATESALADANKRLAALQQDHLGLACENGRLEGQLAAQVEVNAARLADAAAVRRDLASRLTRAERALAATQAEAAGLRTELALQARDQDAALAAAAARQAALAAALATAHGEVDRLGQAAAGLSRQLADTEAQRHGLVEQNGELLSRRDGLAADLEATRQQAAEQVQALHNDITHLRDHIAWREQQLQQAAEQVQALHNDITQLRDHIAWREQQLQQAAGLLAAIPDPLAGLPRLLAALVRRVAGEARVAAFADLQAAVAHWQSEAMLPDPLVVSQNEILSLTIRPVPAEASLQGAFVMQGSDGPITAMPRLLAPHDRHFIHTAYEAVLGRAPDAEGEAYYLDRLRAGVHKLTILKQLRRSEEGRAFIPGVAGLDRAIKRHALANLPVIGACVRLITGVEGNNAVHRHLRILANEMACLRSEQAVHLRSLANEMGCLHSEQETLACSVQQLAARPLMVMAEGVPSFQPPPEPAPPPAPVAPPAEQPAPAAVPSPPSLDPGPMPQSLDSQERRLLGSLRLFALTRGAAQ
jgi:hypothetical protein